MNARRVKNSKPSTVRWTHTRNGLICLIFKATPSSTKREIFFLHPSPPIPNSLSENRFRSMRSAKTQAFPEDRQANPSFVWRTISIYTQLARVCAKFALCHRETGQRKFLSLLFTKKRQMKKKIGNLKYVHTKWVWHKQTDHFGSETGRRSRHPTPFSGGLKTVNYDMLWEFLARSAWSNWHSTYHTPKQILLPIWISDILRQRHGVTVEPA